MSKIGPRDRSGVGEITSSFAPARRRVPAPTSARARSVMRGNRSQDTKPEAALRAELHRRGLRFRKHVAVVSGLRCSPDIVFPAHRIAVECRGCFWHRCPQHAILPKSNLDYWLPKLERNVARDARNEAALTNAGWILIVVWEHEDVTDAADLIEAAVRDVPRRHALPR